MKEFKDNDLTHKKGNWGPPTVKKIKFSSTILSFSENPTFLVHLLSGKHAVKI